MKKIFLFLCLIIPALAFSQNNQEKVSITKFEEFASATGRIIKFIDYQIPNISSTFGVLETSIRKVISSGEISYYYRLENLNRRTMIEYSDLVEINKALEILALEVSQDLYLNPDYMESKFRTTDDVTIGYYISKGQAKWYIDLGIYSDDTVFIRDHKDMINQFKNAQMKIEELMSKDKN
jgi:hypothetical protein